MTSSPERGSKEPACVGRRSAKRGQRRADLNRRTEVGLGSAIVSQRAFDFATGIADAQCAPGALRQGSHRVQHVDADSAGRRREAAPDSFNRRKHGRPCEAAEVRRWRRPGRHVEDILQRPPFLDMHGEVWWTLPEREMRGGLRQRRADPFQHGRVILLGACRSRRGEGACQAGNHAHAVRTISGSVRPAQGVHYGVFA
jgi:hypothetical protein